MFTPVDVHAVHRAMIEARSQAKEREERMPSSAQALNGHADQLQAVLEKLLELMPDQRQYYPGIGR